MRSRNLNAAWDNAHHFQPPRANVPNDKFKPKHIQEDWVRSQEAKVSHFEPAKIVQKMKVLNKEINHHGHKLGAQQDFKYPIQKPLVGIKKMNAQKKFAVQAANIAQKNKMAAQAAIVEETLALAPKMQRIPKISNKAIQQTKMQDVAPAQTTKVQGVTAAQKPKAQEVTAAQKTKAQEVSAAQKTKVQDVTAAQKTKTQEVTAAQKTKVQEVTAAQKTKAQEVTAALKTKVQEITAAQVLKAQEAAAAQKTKVQEVSAAQKTRLENDIANVKNKAKQQDDNTSTTKAQINNPEQSKSHENVAVMTKSAQELSAQKINVVTGECKTQTYDQATEKQDSGQSKTAAPSVQKRELSALLAQAVEDELQEIMIQVWQELPDEPSEEADRVAVDKLRNEAGDDLRRVLGLNITKRLLNVFNNLFLKVKFTCRPQMGCLTSFLNEYKIGKFKRIDKNSNTFAAEMDSIEDFDKLCAVKELMCGEAKVTVIPCYKYTQCPENLKTMYDDTYFYEDSVQDHTASPKSKDEVPKAKVMASSENIMKPANDSVNVENKSDLQKPQTSPTNDTEGTATKTAKSESTSDTQKAKTLAANDNVVKPATKTEKNVKNTNFDKLEVKKAVKPVHKDSENDKKDTTNDDKKAIDSTKIITKKSNSKVKAVTTDKVPIEKEISIELGKETQISEYVIKDILSSDDDYDAGIPEYQMDGDEELDDEDILALMSEGVVLDECSGSEDEK